MVGGRRWAQESPTSTSPTRFGIGKLRRPVGLAALRSGRALQALEKMGVKPAPDEIRMGEDAAV